MGAKKVALILTAAGSSTRFFSNGSETAFFAAKKEYQALQSSLFPGQSGGTVLSCAAEAFFCALCDSRSFIFSRFIITLPAEKGHREKALQALNASSFIAEMLAKGFSEPECIEGGRDRSESVFRALEYLAGPKEPDIVLVHDAARPFVRPALILRVLNLCAEKGAAAPALVPVDTCKEADETGVRVVRHLQRSRLAAVQTPQGFSFAPFFKAHRYARSDGKIYTDDTEIWGAYAGDVFLCEGDRANMKITYKEDLPSSSEEPSAYSEKNGFSPVLRAGLGCDTHRLIENRRLLIGGVHIPFEKGELAHSDGDVLLHAVTDAVLGAAGIGDIGELFPPSDNRWKDADSAFLLKKAYERAEKAGWILENLDCVITIERPKLLPWRNKIRESIARIFDCKTDRVFVKAKTAEGLGDIGSGNAVSAQCVCLLRLKK